MRRLSHTRLRLTLALALPLSVVVLAVVALFYVAFTQVEQAFQDQSLAAQARDLSSHLDNSGTHLGFGGSNLFSGESQQGVAVGAVLFDPSGAILDASGPTVAPSALRPAARTALAAEAGFSTVALAGNSLRVYALAVNSGEGQAVVAAYQPLGAQQATQGRLLVLLAGSSLLLVVLGAVLGYWVSGRALGPVRRIAETARTLSEHDLHRRLDINLPEGDELGELAATFNQMLARLEAAFGGLQRFTADASHELRTPLTLVRSELEVALARPRDGAEYRRVLGVVKGEVARLSRLADQLLLLARSDSGALTSRAITVDVVDLVEETVARWQAAAARASVVLRASTPQSGTLEGDPDLLRTLLDNLVDNAIRHTPAGGSVDVSARREGQAWLWAVADTGAGIPPEAAANLFERFARGDAARGRDSGGAGLGLAIARAVASTHGGFLAYRPAPGGGALFEARLPA